MKRIVLITLAIVLLSFTFTHADPSKAVFKINWVNGVPDWTGLPESIVILGYSVFEQHVNRNHSQVKCWIKFPDDITKEQMKAFREWVKDIPTTDVMEAIK